jgi:hypothetical protein
MLCFLGVMMFTFNFGLINPFVSGWTTLKEYRYKLTTNKNIYITFSKTSEFISVDLAFRENFEVDITLGLFGYTLHIDLYDNRNWDYTNHCWEK